MLEYKIIMRSSVYRFAGEIIPPELFVSPIADRGVGTLRGAYASNPGTRQALLEAIHAEPEHSDQIIFADLDEGWAPDVAWLLDRFEDTTGGVSPGKPIVQYRTIDPGAELGDVMGIDENAVNARLQRFFELTRLRPRTPIRPPIRSASDTRTWGGDANRVLGRIRMPEEGPEVRSFLHELGHCGMARLGLCPLPETTVDVDGLQSSTHINWLVTTSGLTYQVENGEWRGTIFDEAVAEALGALANRKLHLARTCANDDPQRLPEIVAPYIRDGGHAGAAPAAVALEMIAKQLDIPSDRYLRMFVVYADAGVENESARQEVAESIYRGTLGRLTLSQLEELPYPINREASLAFLWAVEDAQDVPDHERYSSLFFDEDKRHPSPVVVGNSTT